MSAKTKAAGPLLGLIILGVGIQLYGPKLLDLIGLGNGVACSAEGEKATCTLRTRGGSSERWRVCWTAHVVCTEGVSFDIKSCQLVPESDKRPFTYDAATLKAKGCKTVKSIASRHATFKELTL